jgi:diguanylate cyclase (GGDEF)-like protein/PAS domain S-box-containing protein
MDRLLPHRRQRSRVHVTFAAGVVVLLAGGVLTAFAAISHRDDTDSVSRAEEVRRVASQLSIDLRTLVVGTYARALAPSQARVFDSTPLVRSFRELRALTEDDPQQQRRLDELSRLLANELTRFHRGALAARLGFAPALVQAVESRLGDLDAVLDAVQAAESARQRLRQHRAEHSRNLTLLGLLSSILLALLLTVSAWWKRSADEKLQRALHDAVAQSEQRLRTLLDHTTDSVWWIDGEHRLRGFNNAFAASYLATYRVAAELGQIIDTHQAAGHRESSRRSFDRALAGETLVVEQQVQGGGVSSSHLVTLTPIRSADGTIVGVTAYSKNISERAAMEQALRAQTVALERMRDDLHEKASRDPLTGLCNRRGFVEEAEGYLALAARHRHPLRLYFIDLDGMKRINDELGHEAGDEALIAAAALLRASFNSSDLLARLGGDEFAALSVDAGEERAIVERINFCLDQFNRHQLRRFAIGMSVGSTAYDPASPMSIDELLAEADARMYEQKRRRKQLPLPAAPVRS